MKRLARILCGIAASLLCLLASLEAQDAVRAGHFHVEHPTLLNLGFEWSIEGDANRNATVAVQFRAAGDTKWREGLPCCESVVSIFTASASTSTTRFRRVSLARS